MWNQKMTTKVISSVLNYLYPKNVSGSGTKSSLDWTWSFSAGYSEVLSLPELTPLECKIPVFPGGNYNCYVGRSTSAGVLMCGGYPGTHQVTSSNYLLTIVVATKKCQD